jgi:hypothetical protein
LEFDAVLARVAVVIHLLSRTLDVFGTTLHMPAKFTFSKLSNDFLGSGDFPIPPSNFGIVAATDIRAPDLFEKSRAK